MSKLYDVINRLEEVAARDGENPEIPEEPEFFVAEEKRSPLKRILVIAAVSVAIGLLVAGAALWWKNSFVQIKTATPGLESNAAPQISDSGPVVPETSPIQSDQQPVKLVAQPLQAPETSANRPLQEHKTSQEIMPETPRIMSIDVAGLDRARDEIEQILALETDISPLDVPYTATRKSDIQIGKLNTITIKEKSNRPPAATSSPPQPVVQRDPAEDFTKTTRWLHQAEMYRHQGEWDGAITLYKRVFAITKDPSVANNLAAALIETGRFEEARKILTEAALTAPNDPDIKQNLQVIKQLPEVH